MDNIDSNNGQLNLDLSELRALIFDFDGTLVDSEIIWKDVIYDMYKAEYDVELSHDVLWGSTGKGIDFTVERINHDLELTNDKKEQHIFSSALIAEADRRIIINEPRDLTLEIFEEAKRSKKEITICTASTAKMIEEYTKKHGLDEYISFTVSTAFGEYTQRKPYPYPYLKTLERLNVDSVNAIAIEDSPSGVKSAISAQIPTVAIPHKNHIDEIKELKPAAVVQSFQPILEFLVS